MVEQIITEMDDMEAARQIDQALMNLRKDYPYRDMAHRAFGRLILGRLGLKSHALIEIPETEDEIVTIRYER